MPERTPETCLMADCNARHSHFCIQHVLEVHCPTADTVEALRAELAEKYAAQVEKLKREKADG